MAALHAIDALISIFHNWEAETFAVDTTFLQATSPINPTTLTFINPAVQSSDNAHHLPKLLQEWRDSLAILDLEHIKRPRPSEGYFLTETPACLLPQSTSTTPQQQGQSHRQAPFSESQRRRSQNDAGRGRDSSAPPIPGE